MRELLYKEIIIQKSLLKKNSLYIVFLLGLNVFFINTCGSSLNYAFSLGMMTLFYVGLAVVANSILLEKQTKMLEKMLAIYNIEKIMGAKIILGIFLSQIIAILIYSVNIIYGIFRYQTKCDINVIVIEVIIILVSSIMINTMYALIYLLCDNPTVCSVIPAPLIIIFSVGAIFFRRFKISQMLIIFFCMIVMSFAFLKMLKLIKSDKLINY